MNKGKILLNADGSKFFVKGGVGLTISGVEQEVVEVDELDIDKARKDTKYVTELLNSSKIKVKNKHGT